MDYGDSVNQRIHSWPYRKIINMIKYKGKLAGMEVRDNSMKKILQELVTLVVRFLFQIESIEVYTSALAVGKRKRM